MKFRLEGVDKTIQVCEDSYRQREIMGVDYLSLRIELPEDTNFPIGTTCEYEGVTYKLFRKPSFRRIHSRFVEYSFNMYP